VVVSEAGPNALSSYQFDESGGLSLITGSLGDGQTVLVDALLGTGFEGALRPEMARAIGALNAAGARLLVALDLPSGLDADTGKASEPCVRAGATLTFAALKPGLLVPAARPYVGELACIDIGAPRTLLAELAAGA